MSSDRSLTENFVMLVRWTTNNGLRKSLTQVLIDVMFTKAMIIGVTMSGTATSALRRFNIT